MLLRDDLDGRLPEVSSPTRPERSDVEDGRASDAASGRAAALFAAALMVGSLAVLRGSVALRLPMLCVITGVIVVAFLRGTLGIEQAKRPRHARRVARSPRRVRVWSFVGTATVIALGVGILLGLGWWALLFVVPGLLIGSFIVSARRANPRFALGRPRAWVVLALLPLCSLTWSVELALVRPGPDPLSIRAGEWLRDHHGAGIVNSVERWWYTSHPPPVGGAPTALEHAPTIAAPPVVAGEGSTVPVGPALARVASPVKTPVGNEGVWVAASGPADRPAVASTLLRPDAVHTSLVVGLMRIDPRRTRLRLLSGTEQPDGTSPNGGAIPSTDQSRLIAAFNGGFRMQEAGGGWYSEGRTAVPLQAGAASLVLRDDGRADVGQWGRDDSMDSHVVGVRQNLALIVDGGAPVDGINSADNVRWGKTLGHRVLVPRSGVGVTRDGILIYVGGPGLSVQTLANTLIAAGAVRGMELDINNQWVDAYTFHPGTTGPSGTKLVDTMRYGPEHYLTSQSRDFIAVYSK